MSQLFREEAINAKRSTGLGRIVLIRPVTFAFLTALGVACALAVVLFLSLGQYTKRAHVSGVLVPDKGLIKIVAATPGVVLERRVYEGQAVRSGDVLFVLTMQRQLAGPSTAAMGADEAILGTLRQRRSSLEREQESQVQLVEKQRQQMAQRLRDTQAEADKVNQQVATQRERLASAQQ